MFSRKEFRRPGSGPRYPRTSTPTAVVQIAVGAMSARPSTAAIPKPLRAGRRGRGLGPRGLERPHG